MLIIIYWMLEKRSFSIVRCPRLSHCRNLIELRCLPFILGGYHTTTTSTTYRYTITTTYGSSLPRTTSFQSTESSVRTTRKTTTLWSTLQSSMTTISTVISTGQSEFTKWIHGHLVFMTWQFSILNQCNKFF